MLRVGSAGAVLCVLVGAECLEADHDYGPKQPQEPIALEACVQDSPACYKVAEASKPAMLLLHGLNAVIPILCGWIRTALLLQPAAEQDGATAQQGRTRMEPRCSQAADCVHERRESKGEGQQIEASITGPIGLGFRSKPETLQAGGAWNYRPFRVIARVYPCTKAICLARSRLGPKLLGISRWNIAYFQPERIGISPERAPSCGHSPAHAKNRNPWIRPGILECRTTAPTKLVPRPLASSRDPFLKQPIEQIQKESCRFERATWQVPFVWQGTRCA